MPYYIEDLQRDPNLENYPYNTALRYWNSRVYKFMPDPKPQDKPFEPAVQSKGRSGHGGPRSEVVAAEVDPPVGQVLCN